MAQIASARAGTGRARYYGAAIGLLNEPQLRQMVGDLIGPQVMLVDMQRDMQMDMPRQQ